MNSSRSDTVIWSDRTRLRLEQLLNSATAWDWYAATWIDAYEEQPVRVLVLRNWVYAHPAFRERVSALLQHWSQWGGTEVLRVRGHRALYRDYWVVYEWPDSVTLARFLEQPPPAAVGMTARLVRRILEVLSTGQQVQGPDFFHGCLTPETIFLVPGGRLRLSPPVVRTDWTEIFTCLWPQLPEDVDLYRSPKNQGTLRGDLYSVGIVAYRALTGAWPWLVTPAGTLVRGLREPLRNRLPWLDPDIAQAVEELIDAPDLRLETCLQRWQELAQRYPVPDARWLDWEANAQRDRTTALNAVYQRYLSTLEAGATLPALFWAQTLLEALPPECVQDEFLRAVNELKAALPRPPEAVPTASDMPNLDAIAERLSQTPALAFPVWHAQMEQAYHNGELLLAWRCFRRLKKNRAPITGPIADLLRNLDRDLMTPPESLSGTKVPAAVARARPESWWQRWGMFLALPAVLGVLVFVLLALRNGPEVASLSGPVPPGDEGSRVPALTVCPEDRIRLRDLEQVRDHAVRQQDWEKACEAQIRLLACLSEREPEFVHEFSRAQELCARARNALPQP